MADTVAGKYETNSLFFEVWKPCARCAKLYKLLISIWEYDIPYICTSCKTPLE